MNRARPMALRLINETHIDNSYYVTDVSSCIAVCKSSTIQQNGLQWCILVTLE